MYLLYREEDFMLLAFPLLTLYIILCETLYCVGTFNFAPIGMYQMYSILGIVDGENILISIV